MAIICLMYLLRGRMLPRGFLFTVRKHVLEKVIGTLQAIILIQ